MTALRLGSLFDGIGVFPLAAVRCGIEPIWASEIEKAPISITERHFPDMQVADAATASRAPENTPAMVKKIGKTTYKVHVHFSNTSTETMSDKIKRMLKNEIQQM